jgi:GT2 family glycosyltransferase
MASGQGEALQHALTTDVARFALPGFRVGIEPDTFEQVPLRIIHPDPAWRVMLVPQAAMASGWYDLDLHFPPAGVVDVVARFAFADGSALWSRLPAVDRNRFRLHFRAASPVAELTLFLGGSGDLRPIGGAVVRASALSRASVLVRRALHVVRRDGWGITRSLVNFALRARQQAPLVISQGSAAAKGERAYDTWMRLFDEAPESQGEWHLQRLAALSRQPLISCLTAAPDSLATLKRSLSDQFYPHWELVTAPTAARGEYVLTIPAGAVLPRNALLEFALTLERHPDAGLIYSDEDRIDAQGRRSDPRFKPAWSPDLFASLDYIGPFALTRREHAVARRDAQDIARMSQPIVHVAKVLLHRPVQTDSPPRARVRFDIPSPAPLVSLIVPTRDRADLLGACIRSILARTDYAPFEILVVDNDSREQATHRLFAELRAHPALRILAAPGPFNYSALNNMAARAARGSILALVNNDVEVVDRGWLGEMAALGVRPEVGCVGAKLIYPDGRIQHAGIQLGIGGAAGHGHRFAQRDAPGYLGRLTRVHNVSAVTGACLVVRKSVFEEVGGLDEADFPVAYNDVDLCLKVDRAGYRNLWTPFAELIHHEQVSRGRDLTPAQAARASRELRAFQRRWGERLFRDPYYSPNLTLDAEDFSVRVR